MTSSPDPSGSPNPVPPPDEEPRPISVTPLAIEAVDLHKSYGHTKAVSGVSFTLRRGEILGFLGPNGAGKSTTLRMLTGSLVPDHGSARVDGVDIATDPLEVRRRFGYLPESLPLYWEMQVEEYLRFIARGRGLYGAEASRRIDAIIEQLGLGRMRRRTTGALSKGFRQRVGLAQAMLHDPPVLILDEPTNGLDPQQIFEIRRLLRNLAEEHAILFSTHILQEIAAVCQRIMVIYEGKLTADDRAEELVRAKEGKAWQVVTDGGEELNRSIQKEFGLSTPVQTGIRRIYEAKKSLPSSEALEKRVLEAGGELIALRRAQYTLEEAYLQLTGVGSQVGAEISQQDTNAEGGEG